MKPSFKILKTGTVVSLIAILNLAIPCDLIAQCTENSSLDLPNTYINAPLSGGGSFNLMVNGNYASGDGIIEGRLAVGGNFNLTSLSETVGLSVGLNPNTSATTDNFVVQGNFKNGGASDIQVKGNFQYNTVQIGSALPIHNVGEGTNQNNANLIDFSSAKTYYQGLSNTLAGVTQTLGASYNVDGNGLLTLTGTGAVANYSFNVTLPASNMSGISFVNIPNGSSLTINILNMVVAVTPVSGSVPMANNFVTKTIFNFPNAENLLISDFKVQGSVLAPNANLSSQNGKVYGSVYIGNNIIQAVGFEVLKGCSSPPLPVRLSAFKGIVSENRINLNWNTVSEINSDRFELEKSKNGKNWQSIGFLIAGNNSTSEIKYMMSDYSPWNGVNLYRLKIIDLDKTYTYSRMISISFDGKNQFYTYPNPVSDRLYFGSEILTTAQMVEIVDSNGNQKYKTIKMEESIDVSNWARGLYIVRYKSQLGSINSNKLMIK